MLLLQCGITLAQHAMSIKPRQPIICYHSYKNNPDHIPAPRQPEARTKTATFQVEYINFPADNQARIAFQRAVDIWATQLNSTIPIKIRAQWQSLNPGVLGQAVWGSAHANFDGAPNLNTFYPVALAEKIAGRELNEPDDPEIVASFNSGTNWYFGIDGNTPTGKMDLVTIVLHEIAHGLGFTDTYDVVNTQGSVGLGNDDPPLIYDLFVENGTGQKLFTEFVSPSASMGTQLTSNSIFYNSPLATAGGSGTRPRLFAPSPFDGGSSIAHLNENTYNTAGDPNRLMTPQIDFAESIHNPGSILLNIFKDMGWVFTKIQHERLRDTERKDGAPYVVKAKILSDNGYLPDQVKLFYTTDNVTFTQVAMTPTGVTDEFQASLPGVTTNWGYGYYISVVDVLNRTFTNPGKIQTQKQQPVQDLVVFNIGTDSQAPEIVHTPVDYIFNDETELAIEAAITDNLGVQQVRIEYSINGGALQQQVMQQVNGGDNLYRTMISIPPGLVIGNKIEYKIVATDNSAGANLASAPDNGNYSILITGIMAVRDAYITDFNQPSIDFIGSGLRMTTPSGFTNAGIHSDHPYKDGSGINNEGNYIYQLQVPIRLNAGNPFIQFDEVVLVEPSKSGAVFGDIDFYDYVIVEGSKDGGHTWKPFVDGYNARADAAWLTRYNLNISHDNSLSTGNSQLFRKRTINMLEKNAFAAGDEVLIRFRLYADQAAHGWGWAIDNLSIQGPVTGIEVSMSTTFATYPNPATQDVTIEFWQPHNDHVKIQVVNLRGQVVLNDELMMGPYNTTHQIDISTLQAGLYFIRATSGEETVIRKLVKVGEGH